MNDARVIIDAERVFTSLIAHSVRSNLATIESANNSMYAFALAAARLIEIELEKSQVCLIKLIVDGNVVTLRNFARSDGSKCVQQPTMLQPHHRTIFPFR